MIIDPNVVEEEMDLAPVDACAITEAREELFMYVVCFILNSNSSPTAFRTFGTDQPRVTITTLALAGYA